MDLPTASAGRPSAAAVTIDYKREPGRVRVVVRRRRPILVVVFLCAWLVVWCFGESTALHQVVRRPGLNFGTIFVAVWLLGWTIGGLVVLAVILGILADETITVDHRRISLGVQLGPARWSRSTRAEELANMGVATTEKMTTRRAMPQSVQTCLAFETRGRTRRFAAGVQEQQAQELLEVLRQQLGV